MPSSLSRNSVIQSKYSSFMLLIAVYVAIISGTRYSVVDDAYISFRYAYQLANHGTLFFNLGEPVEGITNLLWTVFLASIYKYLHIQIGQAALLSSLVFLFLACVRLWQLGPILGTTHLAGSLSAILLLTSSDFLSSSTNGLEVALYTFLLIEILYNYSKDQFFCAYVFAGLLFLTRPEGLFIGILIIGLVFFKYRSLRKIYPGIIIIGLFVMAATIYRILTYGALLPNSVIAKSFPLNLLPDMALPIFRYIVGFVKSNVYFVIIALGGSFALIRAWLIKDREVEILLFCVTCILFSIVVMVRNGGDWMGNHRLLVQYGILYSVLLIVLVSNHSLSIWFAAALVTLPFLQTTNLFVDFKPEFFPRYRENTSLYAEVATRLAPVLDSSDSISAEAIGFISFRLIDTQFIDPLGLTNAYIARNGDPEITYGKSDFTYVTGTLKPSVMIWHYPGHMRKVDSTILSNYESYCLGICKDWTGFLVMIRQDREKDLAPAFSDWQKIDINTEWAK